MDPIIHKGYLDELANAYVPTSVDRKSAHLAFIRGFARLPTDIDPSRIGRDVAPDATRFAAAAGSSDVAVTLEIWPHMIHARPLWNAKLEDGRVR